MGFIENAADASLGLTLDRVRQGLDAGEFDQRPELDKAQQREFLEDQAGGRTDELYRQCLLYHGFEWYDMLKLRQLPGGHLKTEGEWRNAKLGLAFGPQNLTSGFPMGPESLDKYLRDFKLAEAVSKGKVPKEVLRAARLRR